MASGVRQHGPAEVEPMRNFLATVLSVIAAGVMLIAYGLLSPRDDAGNDTEQDARDADRARRIRADAPRGGPRIEGR